MSAETVTATPRGHHAGRVAVTAIALAVALVVVCVVSLGLGQYALSPVEVLSALQEEVD